MLSYFFSAVWFKTFYYVSICSSIIAVATAISREHCLQSPVQLFSKLNNLIRLKDAIELNGFIFETWTILLLQGVISQQYSETIGYRPEKQLGWTFFTHTNMLTY